MDLQSFLSLKVNVNLNEAMFTYTYLTSYQIVLKFSKEFNEARIDNIESFLARNDILIDLIKLNHFDKPCTVMKAPQNVKEKYFIDQENKKYFLRYFWQNALKIRFEIWVTGWIVR